MTTRGASTCRRFHHATLLRHFYDGLQPESLSLSVGRKQTSSTVIDRRGVDCCMRRATGPDSIVYSVGPVSRPAWRLAVQLPMHMKFTPGVGAVELKINEVPDTWVTPTGATLGGKSIARDPSFEALGAAERNNHEQNLLCGGGDHRLLGIARGAAERPERVSEHRQAFKVSSYLPIPLYVSPARPERQPRPRRENETPGVRVSGGLVARRASGVSAAGYPAT